MKSFPITGLKAIPEAIIKSRMIVPLYVFFINKIIREWIKEQPAG